MKKNIISTILIILFIVAAVVVTANYTDNFKNFDSPHDVKLLKENNKKQKEDLNKINSIVVSQTEKIKLQNEIIKYNNKIIKNKNTKK